MTLRWRLNLFVLALIAVFLTAAGLTVQLVRQNAEQTHIYLRMREASQFTADLSTRMYQQLAYDAVTTAPSGSRGNSWPASAMDDIDIQIHQSVDERERQLWENVRAKMATILPRARSQSITPAMILEIEQDLRELRNYYDLTEYTSAVRTAYGTYWTQVAIGSACGLTVLLFLLYLVIVRRWMIRPIQILKKSADTIGQGRLDHRVPLTGADELSQLGRSIDAMAEGLAHYQTDLVRSRELSALGELCANVAHGLRNPLAAIRSTAQLAERRAEADEHRQAFRDLSAQADRMDQRITTLFQFSRPIDLRRRPIPFRDIAESAQAQALPLLKSKGITTLVEDATADLKWNVDAAQLAAALAELLTNAAHHSPPGSSIIIKGETAGSVENGALVMQVIDHGKGMSSATAQKAFDLFFTSRPEGTGVGLTLVRRIIERHEGKVSIESTPGEGTRVICCIPETGNAVTGANGHSNGLKPPTPH